MAILFVKPAFKQNGAGFSSQIHLEVGGVNSRCIRYEYRGDIVPAGPADSGWALLTVLPYAMQHGYDVHVEGRVERLLLERLEEYQRAWIRWEPRRYRAVGISADSEFAPPPPMGRTAVQAFSGGMDSIFSLHAHTTGLLGRNCYEIKAALFLDLVEVEDVDRARGDSRKLADLSATASSYGVPLTVVSTNVRSFYPNSWSFTHISAIAGALMQFSGQVDCGIVAADFSYEKEILGWGNNSISNQLISGAVFPIVTTGAGWGRTEKARELKNNQAALNHLNVCYNKNRMGARNCGACEKCIRTKLNFIAAGQDEFPALGDVPTANQVLRISARKQVARNFFEDLLENGDWTNRIPLKQAVEAVVRASKDNSQWGRAMRAARKLKQQISALVH